LQASRAKISVFLFAVVTLVCIEGTVMYLLEGEDNPGFHNIPQSIYWAIVTITTVGYGDAAPVTVLGKMMASVIMLTGFAIIAVPTGVVSVELGRELTRRQQHRRRCPACEWDEHDPRARFCQQCGTRLPD
jgi:voltage-gated potassium channel